MNEEVGAAANDAGVETTPAPPKRKIKFNQDTMTLGDYEQFEELTGMAFSDAVRTMIVRDEKGIPVPDPENGGRPLQEVKMSMKALIALLFVTERKVDPSITMDAIREMPITEIEFEVPKDGDGPKET